METNTYIDMYLLPVYAGRLDEYRTQAEVFGEVAREHGALSYREFLADDLGDSLKVEDGLVLVSAVVEFRDRPHRDEVMGKVLDDPRVKELGERDQPGDMSRMSYGGFAPFVTA